MGKCTFKGGVHPYDGKEFSKDKPVKELFPAQGEMVFHFHSTSVHLQFPVVAKGDYVLAGQLYCRSGWICFGKYSFVRFRYCKAIEPRTLATGASAMQSSLKMMVSTKK